MMIKALFFMLITIFLFANCKKEENIVKSLTLSDTLNICQGDCLSSTDGRITVCMDSVLNDSRCPVDAVCFWEGNASVRFYFKVESEKISVVLNNLSSI